MRVKGEAIDTWGNRVHPVNIFNAGSARGQITSTIGVPTIIPASAGAMSMKPST